MDENVVKVAADVTAALLERMGIEAQLTSTPDGDEGVRIVVAAGDADGVVIGHRGETLASLQHVVNRVVNKEYKNDKNNVTIDVSDYQERRRLQLVEMAEGIAATVKDTRRDQITEMLPASERRIVHQAVADLEGVTSFSLGDGQMKRMVIALEDEAERIVVDPEELLANAPRGPRREGDGPRSRGDGDRDRGGRGGRGGRERGGDRGDRRGGDRGGRGERDEFPPRDVPPSDGRVRDLIKADKPREKSSFRIVLMPPGFQAALEQRKDLDDQK